MKKIKDKGLRVFCLTTLLFTIIVVNSPARAEYPRYVLITILHTNDLHGNIKMGENPNSSEDRGGLACLATKVLEIRKRQPQSLFLDAGDIIHGTPLVFIFKGEPMIQAMNLTGYDAATVGNHDFDWGKETLEKRIKEANFPFLSANLTDLLGKQWDGVKPYIIKEVSQVKIAILGLTTPQTKDIAWEGNWEGVEFFEPVKTAKEYLPELKERADIIIALTHLGKKEDENLAKEVPGIDIIIGGDSHTQIDPLCWVNRTMIAQAGAYAQYLGRIDLIAKEKKEGGYEIVSVNGRDGIYWKDLGDADYYQQFPRSALIKIDKDLLPLEDIENLCSPYYQELNKILNTHLGETEVFLEGKKAELKETNLGNLITDIIRSETQADLSIFDTTIIKDNIPPGEIKVNQLFKVLPFYTAQNIVLIRISKEKLRKVLEHSVGEKFRRLPLLLQVSGFSFTYNPHLPSGSRVLEIRREGKILDEKESWTLATTAHLIKGGSGFEMLKESEVIEDTKTCVRDMVIQGIKKLGRLNPQIERRITVKF